MTERGPRGRGMESPEDPAPRPPAPTEPAPPEEPEEPETGSRDGRSKLSAVEFIETARDEEQGLVVYTATDVPAKQLAKAAEEAKKLGKVDHVSIDFRARAVSVRVKV